MTQRIFDIENEKDMADLWDILPEMVKSIEKDEVDFSETMIPYNKYMGSGYCIGGCPYIAINWHDITVINRPIQEATEQDIGKLCVFYDDINNGVSYGILEKIRTDRDDFKYLKLNCLYKHCHRLTKQEIEELC